MKQRYFCFICLVEGKIEGIGKRGRRRKQLYITITKREGTGMRGEALIALGEDSFWKGYGPVARHATDPSQDTLRNERMKVELEYALLPVLRFSSVSIIPPIF